MIDIIITYLHGSLDNDVYMRLLKDFNLFEVYDFGSQDDYSIELNTFFYGLKQPEQSRLKFWREILCKLILALYKS